MNKIIQVWVIGQRMILTLAPRTIELLAKIKSKILAKEGEDAVKSCTDQKFEGMISQFNR